jgi:5-methyltetrahydrofolate--homocysteine methyltransferase
MSLKELPDDDLWLQIQDDLYDGMKEEVAAGTREALERGYGPQEVLAQGLVAGMDIVGVDFRDGVLFVPEVLMSANAMKAGMEILRPLLAETGAPRIGTMVIGTVKGDIHDIGKNLVAMMMEGAGFEVVNLGINNDAQKFIDAIHAHQPDIIGMSALLTTTMPYMKVVIQALKDEGLREQVYVMVGGAPVTEAFAQAVGADAYGRDAAVAVEIAKAHMASKRGDAVAANHASSGVSRAG